MRWGCEMEDLHLNAPTAVAGESETTPIEFAEIGRQMAPRWKIIAIAVVLCAAAGFGASYLLPARYTATAVLLPPQPQGGAASALASLGALSSLVGNGAAGHAGPEQYIALMQSVTVADRIIAKFDLQKLWGERYLDDARKKLAKRVEITTNKKDGLITIQATDTNPTRSAAMANQYVEELRRLTNNLAVTEAQQRRVFFEHLLEQTRDKLAAAQLQLEGGGYNSGAINAEPRSAAEGYAQLDAALTAAKVKLQVMRSTLADTAPEVVTQREAVNALSEQVAKLEAKGLAAGKDRDGGYISRYREYKYQETLFDLFARQYENARVDESREGALIQTVDPAQPPERKSWPNRFVCAGGAAFFALLACAALATRRVIRARRAAPAGVLGS